MNGFNILFDGNSREVYFKNEKKIPLDIKNKWIIKVVETDEGARMFIFNNNY